MNLFFFSLCWNWRTSFFNIFPFSFATDSASFRRFPQLNKSLYKKNYLQKDLFSFHFLYSCVQRLQRSLNRIRMWISFFCAFLNLFYVCIRYDNWYIFILKWYCLQFKRLNELEDFALLFVERNIFFKKLCWRQVFIQRVVFIG